MQHVAGAAGGFMVRRLVVELCDAVFISKKQDVLISSKPGNERRADVECAAGRGKIQTGRLDVEKVRNDRRDGDKAEKDGGGCKHT